MKQAKPIIVGCGEWGFRNLPMADHFAIARDFGFQWLEFGIGGGQAGRLPEAPSAGDIAAFRELSAAFEIDCPFCCIENDFTLPDPARHAGMLRKVRQQVQAAAECGATHVRLFAGFTPVEAMTEPIWERLIEAFAECDDLCAELGLLIAIETHGAIEHHRDGSAVHRHTVSTHRDSIRRLVDELPARIGFNFDPGNLKAADPDDRRFALDLLDDRINYCHLKDWKKSGAGWAAAAIGDDDLDYGDLLPRMRFDGVHLIEYEPLEDTRDGIRRSLDYLRRLESADEQALRVSMF